MPRLGKQRAHFTYKNGLYGEAVKQVGGKHGVCQPAAILRCNYRQQQCCRLRTIKKQIVFLEDTLKRYVPNTLKEVAGDQYYFFASTMFPTLDVVHNLGYHEHIWAKYLETIIIIEEKLANDYFSDSLMETLREYIIRNDFSDSPDPNAYLKLSNRIRAIEFSILRTGEFPIPSIIDAVNFTRTSNKDLFQNWKQSDTARLFDNHGYKNKKQSSGYFF